MLLAATVGASFFVGLRTDGGIRVQEYSTEGTSYYCVHNTRVDSVHVVMREYWHEDPIPEEQEGGLVRIDSIGPAVSGDTLAVLKLAPMEFVYIPALVVEAGHYIRVLANGTSIGMFAGEEPPEPGRGNPVSMASNLNSPGLYDEGLRTEQASLWVTSGEEFTVDLVLEKDVGVVKIGRILSRHYPEQGFLAPLDIASNTLVYSKQRDEFVISSSGPTVQEGVHRAELRFQAPVVDRPTLLYFWGWHWIKYDVSARPIVRAILVRPEDAEGLPPN